MVEEGVHYNDEEQFDQRSGPRDTLTAFLLGMLIGTLLESDTYRRHIRDNNGAARVLYGLAGVVFFEYLVGTRGHDYDQREQNKQDPA